MRAIPQLVSSPLNPILMYKQKENVKDIAKVIKTTFCYLQQQLNPTNKIPFLFCSNIQLTNNLLTNYYMYEGRSYISSYLLFYMDKEQDVKKMFVN